MSDIIRRNKAIPVEARRAEGSVPVDPPDPQTIRVPGPAAEGAAGSFTQNIYLTVPNSQPQAAPPPAASSAPQQVHYHTTNVYESPKRRRLGKSTSFLGTLGFVIGGIGCGAAYVPQVMSLAKPIAEAGLMAAGLGMLGAMLFQRVGRGMPLLGLIASAAAFGLWMKNTGQLPKDLESLPKIDFTQKSVSAPAIAPSVVPSAAPPVAPSNAPARLGDHSIFGSGSPGWTHPADEPVTPSAPSVIAPAQVSPSPDLSTSIANLDTARLAAAKRMGLDYAGAKAAAAKASADYQQAKITDDLGSPELAAASQHHMEADSQLKQIEMQLDTDATVAAAEQAVTAAKSKK